MKNPVLSLSLSDVMRPEIALPLQQMLNIYTVGCLLRAWRSPKSQRSIEKLFDSRAIHEPVPAWWVDERAVDITGGMQNAA